MREAAASRDRLGDCNGTGLVADFPGLSRGKLPLQQALRVEANASELTTATSSDIIDPVYPSCRATLVQPTPSTSPK